MISSIKPACCLLLIVCLFQQTTSINVKRLCAYRCLHHRGGILCNCNAFHFAGKRSDYLRSSPQELYTQSGTQENSSGYPAFLEEDEENARAANKGLYRSVDLPSSYNLLRDKYVDSGDMESYEQALSGIRHPGGFGGDENLGLEGTHLPSLAFPRMRTVDLNRGDSSSYTQEDVASKIRQIMSGPFQEAPDHERNDGGGDLVSKGLEGESISEDKSDGNLAKLEKVLTRALHLR